jgi:tetratricopeptide (TPR) repeat protein
LGGYYLAYQNYARLGVTYLPADKSVEFLELATRKFPKSDLMQFLLAIAEYKNQNYENALTAARKAYTLSPSQQNAYVLNQLQNGLPINVLDE